MVRVPHESLVLQRRAGYREVYRAFLLFESASSIRFDFAADVFAAGTKDVAALYEYWVFWKILEVVQGLIGAYSTSHATRPG